MSKNMRLRINFGENQFVVNCNDYTYEKVVDLADKVSDIRRSHSLFSKYPLEEEETREKWRERIAPLIEADAIRKEGEAVDEHLRRLFDAKVETHEMAYQIITAIAEVFKLNKPSENDFKRANWLDVRSFIYDVLSMGDIPADDYFPRKPLGA